MKIFSADFDLKELAKQMAFFAFEEANAETPKEASTATKHYEQAATAYRERAQEIQNGAPIRTLPKDD